MPGSCATRPAASKSSIKLRIGRILEVELSELDVFSSGAFLPSLPVDWRLKKTYRAGSLHQLVMETLTAVFQGSGIIYGKDKRPKWWPHSLPFPPRLITPR